MADELTPPAGTPPADPNNPNPAPAAAPADPNNPTPPADPAAPPADPNTPPPGEPGDEPPAGDEGGDEMTSGLEFYKSVDALYGEDLKVDFASHGITDPLSPEGLKLRDEALIDREVKRYEGYLKSKDPRGFAYLLHRANGGSDEEFFAKPTVTLPEYETFKGNVDLQKKVIKDGYRARGLDEDAINLIIDDAEKKSKLFTLADSEYNSQKTATEKALADLERQTVAAEQAFQASLQKLESGIDDVIFKGKTPNLVIPEAKQADFANFVKSMLGYNNQTKQFLFTQQVEADKMPAILESLYFLFSGGKLETLVKRQAQTQVARKLGQKVQASAAAAASPNKDKPTGTSFVPLSAIN